MHDKNRDVPDDRESGRGAAAQRMRAVIARTNTPTLLDVMRGLDTTTEEGRIAYAMTGAHLAARLGLDPVEVANEPDPVDVLRTAAVAAAAARSTGR